MSETDSIEITGSLLSIYTIQYDLSSVFLYFKLMQNNFKVFLGM